MNESKKSFNSGGVTGERKKLTAMVSVFVYWVCVCLRGRGRVFFPRLKQQLPLPPSPPLCVYIYIYMIIIIIIYKHNNMCMYGLSYGGKVVTGNAGSFTRSEPPSCVLHNTHTHIIPSIFLFLQSNRIHTICVRVYTLRPCALLLAELRARQSSLFPMRPHLPPFCHTARDIRRRCYLVLTEQI